MRECLSSSFLMRFERPVGGLYDDDCEFIYLIQVERDKSNARQRTISERTSPVH